MSTRAQAATAAAGAHGAGRRAFRDVTNATRVAENNIKADDTHPLVEKKSTTIVHNEIIQIQPVPARVISNDTAVDLLNNQPHVSRQNSFASSVASTTAWTYQHAGRVDDIDQRDSDDPLCATGYVQDMYHHFRHKELQTSVRPVFMESQPYINERMRAILIDWLVEVHLKFKLVPETLYLTVNIIDRFLEKQEVSRQKLQLVGVTALLLASKYEEIYPPELRDLVYICDRAYTRNDILEMEELILRVLQYQITIPSAHAFLVRFLKAAHADKKMVQISCYILDGTLQSYNLLHYLPSQLAAAAVYVARKCVGRNPWSPTLLRYAGYLEEDIVPIARAVLADKAITSSELNAVHKKYSSSKYGQVAEIPITCDF